MENIWLVVASSFLLAFIITLSSVSYVIKLAFKINAVDHPKKRGLHNKTMPLMGGLSIYLGFTVSIVIIAFLNRHILNTQFIGFIVASTIIIVGGILDDIKDLRAYQKLAFQIIASLIVIGSGTSIDSILYPVYFDLNIYLNYLLTIFWIVGFTNAVNLVDGVDGLAAGISTISSFFLMILCILTGDTLLSILFTSALAGSCLGFLPRNFSPAEIFMGDTGSTFLGFVLSVTSIMGVFKSYALVSIAIISLAIALPVFDTLFAIVRRGLTGKPIMKADRGHLHHKLLDSGLSHKSTVLILYGLSFLGGLMSLTIAFKNIVAFILILILILVATIMVYTYNKRTK